MQYNIKPKQLDGLEDLALLLARLGFKSFAVMLLGLVAAQRQLFSMPSEPYNQDNYNSTMDSLKAALELHEFESCWAKGQAADFQSISHAVLNRAWLTSKVST
jgi:hypothetical protein